MLPTWLPAHYGDLVRLSLAVLLPYQNCSLTSSGHFPVHALALNVGAGTGIPELASKMTTSARKHTPARLCTRMESSYRCRVRLVRSFIKHLGVGTLTELKVKSHYWTVTRKAIGYAVEAKGTNLVAKSIKRHISRYRDFQQ